MAQSEAAKAAWRRYYARNAEAKREKSRAYRRKMADVPEYRAKRAEESRRYAETHRSEAVARSAAWAAANRERHLRLHRETAARYPEKRKIAKATRRSQAAGSGGSHTAEDVRQIVSSQCGLCAYCLSQFGDNYHVDHVIPLSRGGDNSAGNLVASCVTCNLSKGRRTVLEFLQRRAA